MTDEKTNDDARLATASAGPTTADLRGDHRDGINPAWRLVLDSTDGNIVPTPYGGIQLEWHRDGVDLEIEFDKDGSISSVFFGPSRPVGYHGMDSLGGASPSTQSAAPESSSQSVHDVALRQET